MERAWHIFKIIFSSLLVLLAILFFVVMNFSHNAPFSPLNIGIPAGLVFFAAIPWVASNSEKKPRAAGLMGIVLSIGFISMTTEAFKDEIKFPMSCSPRSQIGCDFLNWLYSSYGSNAVGIFLMLFSTMALVGSVIIMRRGREKT